jgi:hypothetical protein
LGYWENAKKQGEMVEDTSLFWQISVTIKEMHHAVGTNAQAYYVWRNTFQAIMNHK